MSPGRLFVVSASIGLLAAAPALAQPRGAPTPSSAAPAATSIVSPAAPPEDPAVVEARAHYNRGLALYYDGDYKLALIEIQRSYEMSHNWRILYNLGQVNLQLNHYADAMAALEKYVREGGNDVPQQHRADVDKQLAALRDRTAHITITTNIPGVEIAIDDAVVGMTPLPPNLLVDAGSHRVTATKADYRLATKSVTLVGMEQQNVTLTLTKEGIAWRPAEAPPANYVWVGWATTGALAAGAIATGLLAYNANNEVNSLRKQTGLTTNEIPSEETTVKAWGIASDVLTGAAVVAGGVSLYFTLRKTKEAPKPSTTVGVGPGSVVVQGSF
jgi:PEGA domain